MPSLSGNADPRIRRILGIGILGKTVATLILDDFAAYGLHEMQTFSADT